MYLFLYLDRCLIADSQMSVHRLKILNYYTRNLAASMLEYRGSYSIRTRDWQVHDVALLCLKTQLPWRLAYNVATEEIDKWYWSSK